MSTTAATSGAESTRIRTAVRSDADVVFRLLRQVDEFYAPDRQAFDSTFDSFLTEDPGTLLLVAEDADGAVRGYALVTINGLLHTNGRAAQLQELAVDSDARGSGLGTRLIDAIETYCRERDVKQLTVPSRRSADFYERLGYHSTADFLKKTFDY
jgi:ribosomal protein S18 acetylase RimI-like enzyme